ncbi:type IV pilus modification protein PilV [Nitrincola tapanii]|nr:type IV pilus modification protein PilV [Nitrincola tapanii]
MCRDRFRANRRGFKQRGITLLESLIAMVVIAIGFSSIVMLQLRSMQSSQSSFQQSIAAVQATDLVERLWANACVLNDEVRRDEVLGDWRGSHEEHPWMPNWTGEMDFDEATSTYEITISWLDRLATGDEEDSNRTFRYLARIPVLDCN